MKLNYNIQVPFHVLQEYWKIQAICICSFPIHFSEFNENNWSFFLSQGFFLNLPFPTDIFSPVKFNYWQLYFKSSIFQCRIFLVWLYEMSNQSFRDIFSYKGPIVFDLTNKLMMVGIYNYQVCFLFITGYIYKNLHIFKRLSP